MKHVCLLVIGYLLCYGAFAQIVTSSCTASDSIVSLYYGDAQQLALRKTYNENFSWKDSLYISPTHTDTFLRALLAVYNANLPARDSVVGFAIHTFMERQMKFIRFRADSGLAWIHPVKNHQFPTGDSLMDSLMDFYYMKPKGGYTSLSWAYYVLNLLSDSNYNARMFSAVFDSVPGVSKTEPAIIYGDGSDITAVQFPGYMELTYKLGAGDCPAGCIYQHFWKFKVYNDCSVEFVSSYGTPLYTQITTHADIHICSGDSVQLGLLSCAGCSYYTWSSPNSTTFWFEESPVVTPTITTVYSVSASGSFMFPGTAQVMVNVTPLPHADFVVTSDSGYCPAEVYFTDSSEFTTSRQWTIDTGVTPSLVSTTINVGPIQYYSPGTYQVKLDVSNICGTDSEVRFIQVECVEGMDTATSITEASPSLIFKLSPNPSSEKVELYFTKDLVGGVLSVYDVTGQEVRRLAVTGEEMILDFSAVSSGIYYLHVYSYGKPVVPIKFIRN